MTNSQKQYDQFLHLSCCSLLCFERVAKAVRDSERIIISLKTVKEIKKAKPFAVLPGSGMSIDVVLKEGDKVGYLLTVVLCMSMYIGYCWPKRDR